MKRITFDNGSAFTDGRDRNFVAIYQCKPRHHRQSLDGRGHTLKGGLQYVDFVDSFWPDHFQGPETVFAHPGFGPVALERTESLAVSKEDSVGIHRKNDSGTDDGPSKRSPARFVATCDRFESYFNLSCQFLDSV